MSGTVTQIKDKALRIIGEVDGGGVQAFDDDRMMENVISAFNLIFKKFHWPQYCTWIRFQLDGTNGFAPSGTFANVLDFEDFIAMHADASSVKIPRLPKFRNPFAITGTQLQFWDSLHVTNTNFATRKLIFYPITSTDYVNAYVRLYPITTAWDWTDTMYFDVDMLAYGAAYMALVGDDLNANAAETNKALMELRYRDIIAGISSHEISLTDAPPVPADWFPATP